MNESHYKEFNNCWWVNHPTINFFTFDVEVVMVFGHKCILEKYQDGEIWSDDEYWGSVLYDFDNDKYINFPIYVLENDIEEILNKWMENKENLGDIWDGKISNDFIEDDVLADDESRLAVDFYKSYIASNTDLDFEDYYKKIYNKQNN